MVCSFLRITSLYKYQNEQKNPFEIPCSEFGNCSKDSKSITGKFDEIMSAPSPNPRYGDKSPIELVGELLKPKQSMK